MRSVELFAGAGGLALGCELAGFTPEVIVEWDKWACDTIRENKKREYPLVRDWSLHEGDVRDFQWSSISKGIDLVAGGPPCQPFSMGGKHRAYNDDRDMFPATVEIVRKLRPKAFIIENVKGLTRSAFANYYQYILFQLQFPEISRGNRETWFNHFRRLQQERTAGAKNALGLTYNIAPTLVNAADYGIPQKRERIFIVGFRSDLGIEWSFPKSTHSYDSLLKDQWMTGDYWERHEISLKKRPQKPDRLASRIEKLKTVNVSSNLLPWRTVRDALVGLPDPEIKQPTPIADHKFQGGAKSYPGHTGSEFDLPAKTLKAGGHGVPGGENMLIKDDGSVRYFTVRESARLQTFPDGFRFHGSWTETMRQLGNAVPVILAQKVASSVAERLLIAKIEILQSLYKDQRKRA
ncbi:MAG TPA: DNA cytosine methyltransferase [Pyrinomonadaceae bacterium]|jgi:DNA (cytosine-5)-methyltransferase 1|nr:DNA cytosine methyltransferase [Pyrinomonadaceae bacterium]